MEVLFAVNWKYFLKKFGNRFKTKIWNEEISEIFSENVCFNIARYEIFVLKIEERQLAISVVTNRLHIGLVFGLLQLEPSLVLVHHLLVGLSVEGVGRRAIVSQRFQHGRDLCHVLFHVFRYVTHPAL